MNTPFYNLKLKPVAIGSLPHNNISEAMDLVKKDFAQIPFFPQLKNLNTNDDMMIQFLEGIPTFSPQNPQQFHFETESEDFFTDLEKFYTEYEEIIENPDSPLIENYGISDNFSSTFRSFEEFIKNTKPEYAKGQIIGPFTLATTMKDQNDKYAIYDETLREIIVKHLTLKALWQIKRIKKANPQTTPIIFMDEPSVSQIGTSAYITISENNVISMIKEISDAIKNNGAISAVHCCGKCDWRIPIKTGVNIINFDAYTFSRNFNIFHSEIKKFLQTGGLIAWGLIPTLSDDILKDLTTDDLVKIFRESVNYLTKNGIDEKLILDSSLITSSCGAGALSVEYAQKAMDLVKELADTLRNEE